jgi:hypothetical protein
MVCCFPLHDLLELNVLTDRWANWALMYQWTMSGEGMDFETKVRTQSVLSLRTALHSGTHHGGD